MLNLQRSVCQHCHADDDFRTGRNRGLGFWIEVDLTRSTSVGNWSAIENAFVNWQHSRILDEQGAMQVRFGNP